MKSFIGIVVLVALGLLARTAYAGDDTFTQIGTWKCDTSVGPAPIICPTSNFPQPFGGTPSMVVQACSFAVIGCAVLFEGDAWMGYTVTALGFTPKVPYNAIQLPGARVVPTDPWVRGTWIAVGPKIFHGTVLPKYMILTVIYAPPGTNGGHSTSSVEYAAGSSTGTTTSASQTFKLENALSFEASGGYSRQWRRRWVEL